MSDVLPAQELTSVQGVMKMLDLSRSSVLRLVDLPEPITLGRSKKWLISDIRNYVKQKRDAVNPSSDDDL